jgi:hypothetical protein
MNRILDRILFRKTFESPEELDQCVVQVIQKLNGAEQHDAAKVLEDWRSTAYTTSSEWLGDLGIAIRKIQKQHKIDKRINTDLRRLLREVHRIWPSI